MLPPCFLLADHVFPAVRQRAARLMAEGGVTQMEIAGRLRVSQAMVSKYLKGDLLAVPADEAWMVDGMAEQAADLDAQVAGGLEPGQANPWCRSFSATLGPEGAARRAVTAEVTRVLARLERAPLAPLVPNVSVNVAGALPDAAARDDVVAFPGRLAFVRGRLRAHGPPEFGASRHLAGMLLAARTEQPELRFVLNLRGGPEVVKALRAVGEKVPTAKGDRRDDSGVPAFALGRARALADPGGFGIEPAVYLFDADAEALAGRVERVAKALA